MTAASNNGSSRAGSRRPLAGVVKGEEIISVRLTTEAQVHGMALALSQVVMARPTGVGRAISTYTCTITIEGRDEWLAAAGLRA